MGAFHRLLCLETLGDYSSTMASSENIMNILKGDCVIGKDGNAVDLANVFKDGTVVGIYFSAHWCPPCRGFTPLLAEFYKNHKENKSAEEKDFEIIFISSDRDDGAFQDYYKEMPWTALRFGSELKDKVSELYEVRGIPTLVLVDGKDGSTITRDGRNPVANGDKTFLNNKK